MYIRTLLSFTARLNSTSDILNLADKCLMKELGENASAL